MTLYDIYNSTLEPIQELSNQEIAALNAEQETALQEQLVRYRRLAEKGVAADRAKEAETLRALAALHRYEYVSWSEYKYEPVQQEYGEALALYRKWAGQKPAECNPHIADVLYAKAEIYLNLSRYEEADKKFQEVIDFCHTKREEDTEYYRYCIASTLLEWGCTYQWRKQYEQAEEKFLALLALGEQWGNDDGTFALNSLAALYREWQKYTLAEAYYLKTLAIERKGMEQQPEQYETSLSLTLINLADVQNTNSPRRNLEKCWPCVANGVSRIPIS